MKKNLTLHTCVPLWLMASYLYYEYKDKNNAHYSLFDDTVFDSLAVFIYKNWKKITHPHKKLIRKDETKTAYYIKKYPSIVVAAAMQLKEELNGKLLELEIENDFR